MVTATSESSTESLEKYERFALKLMCLQKRNSVS